VTNSVVIRSRAIAAAKARGAIAVAFGIGTSRAPLRSAPQISNVDASNAGFASAATVSSGPICT
jgi:hypothetical protein